ncbi:Protein preY, mitochondrial [Mucuna pruriens]|uniref:Protein preY, mitochondrial n=1 Tax=Mucuna pruriens TaxID=157652 RepID=A0A371EWW7_MUCPR|nr:Protein preY, mitochondrial [Mucuna pruriens]
MVRVSKEVLQKAGKTLSDILVCPLSKQPLRYCEESNSLISDAIGVSFPVGSISLLLLPFNFHFQSPINNCTIKDGIPCLVPRDGKILEEEDASKPDNATNLSEENQGRSV